MRVSVVPLPRCGTSSTFSSGSRSGWIDRLVLVDVERGAGEQLLLQRPGERLLVDDRAARVLTR